MKKLTVLFAAVLCAAMSFAKCNEYGWTSVEDMYQGLAADVYASLNDGTCPGFVFASTFAGEFGVSDITGSTGPAFDIQTCDLTFFTGENDYAAKWGWLAGYLDSISAAANAIEEGYATVPTASTANMRYALAAFFANSRRDTWPKSADYANCGAANFLAWQPSWGSSWCIKEDCNPDGWMNADELYQGLAADMYASLNDGTCPGFVFASTFAGEFGVSDIAGSTGPAFDIQTCDLTFFTGENDYAAKWGWLAGYLDSISAAANAIEEGYATVPTASTANMRYALAAFFANSRRDTWPKSADYANCGAANFLAWQPSWGQAFCTGGKIVVTYEMNGAVTNEYGWMNGEDMYWDFVADYNTFAGAEVVTEFGPSKFYDPTYGKAAVETMLADAAYSAKWGWLMTFLTDACREHQGAEPNMTASMMRGAIDNFFNNGALNLGAWNQSYDATVKGVANYDVYASYWKHAFDNPTEIGADEEWVLNTPYKEGETFRGWFFDAAGQGQQVTELTSLANGQTLYAVFGAYQMSLKEVVDADDDAEVYTSGVVNHVDGKNVYIQDATGGMLLYFIEAPAVTVGQRIVVSGVKATYGGAPEVKNAVLKEAAAGELPAAQTLELSNLVADPLRYFGQRVHVNDVRIAKYDSKGNPFVISGPDTVQCYKMVIDQTAFPVGQRVNLTAIAGYYSKFQFVGDIAGFEKIIYQGLKDQNTYDDLVFVDEDGDGGAEGETYTYSIENNWLISENLGNWAANKPNQVAEQCRGMAVKDGIIYITYRASNTPNRGELKLLRYDAETGEKLADLPLKDYVFCEPAADTTGTRCVVDEETAISYLAEGYEWNYDEFTSAPIFGPNTDMHVDYDGNILVANLPTEGHCFQIWKLTADENGVLDGGGELVVYAGGNSGISDFAFRYPDDPAIRLDRFDLAGSVDGDAWIFAPSQNSNIVYEMDIVNGKWDGECWNHVCQNGEVAFSYSPRIAVVDGGEAFYVDGFATHPALFANDGTMLENFAGIVDDEGEEVNPSAMGLLQNEDGTAPATGECGVHEFPVGGAYFLAMGAGSYEGAYQPYGSHLVFRFKNDNRHFYEMQRAWELSKDGFGANKNAQFNYMQCHIQKDDLTTELYLFVAENGIGKYTITADKYFGEQETGLEAVKASVKAGDVKKVMMNGRMFIIRDGKAFSAMGQKF